MKVWVDAQLPPALAALLRSEFGLDAQHLLQLGLHETKDERIFALAREARALVITKDTDFVRLLERSGPPPRILWVTLGNARNQELLAAMKEHWPRLRTHFDAGEALVELGRSRESAGQG